MAGLAGIVNFDLRPVAAEAVTRMLRVAAHRGPDGLDAQARGQVGLGHARFALGGSDRARRQPVWLPDGSCGLVADARLYNRGDLLRALGNVPWIPGEPSDAEILLAAYERWGADAVQRLRGDFALAVWDARTKTLFAARDAFGVKPFFYGTTGGMVCFASEVKQVLAAPGIGAATNECAIAGLLLTACAVAGEETFYAQAKRLLPGHVLVADAAGIRCARWWRPVPGAPARSARPGAVAEAFRAHFETAVARRTAFAGIAALELSGGLDSSAVAIAASRLERGPLPAGARTVTISQVYPGLSCDETDYIEAVLAVAPHRALRFEAPIGDYTIGIGRELSRRDAPMPEISWQRRALGATHLHAEGARVVVTGLGGDEIAWDPDYELDLWRSGHRIGAVLHCLRDPRVLRDRSQRESLMRLARAVLPASATRTARRFFRRDAAALPPWITAETATLALRRGSGAPEHDVRFPSLAQSAVFDWVTAPVFGWLLESEELLAASHGFEVRHPFLDQDLVEFVLGVSWRERRALPGHFKTLLLAAMGERMPRFVRERRRKAAFDEYFGRLEASGRASLRALLSARERWVSGRFVQRSALLAALADAGSFAAAGGSVWRRPWVAAMTELWLRQATTVTAATTP